MSSTTFLCTADLHLGRRPSRLPSDDEELSVGAVWERIVEEAIRRGVDGVLMAGDVVDRENRYYEALGPLQEGVRRLMEAGVEVAAVGGNHDWDVLPRVARSLESDRFHLLGEGGEWESLEWRPEEGPAVDLYGWSYPAKHVSDSPVRSLEVEADVPAVGLFHTELGGTGSGYAPVELSELESSGVATWLLGHRHAASVHEFAGGRAFYPGSPQPLDPTEQGAHGGTLLEIDDRGEVSLERISLATVRYAETAVDVSEVEDESSFGRVVPARVRDAHRELAEEAMELEWIAHRVKLVGRSEVHRRLGTWARPVLEDFRPTFEGVDGHVEDVRVETRPDHDLEDLARGNDPPGVVAELLLALEGEEALDSEQEALVEEVREALVDRVYHRAAYAPLREDEETADPPDEATSRELLVEAGRLLLDQMLAEETPSGRKSG